MNNKKIIKGKVKDIKLSEPILYIDNEARNRSGHMGHPMLNLGNGKIIDFNSNVSSIRCDGHSGFARIMEKLLVTLSKFHIQKMCF